MWKPYYLWGEVDRTNYNFTLWYSNDDNRDHANQLNLTHGGHNNHWFIIYSVQLPDEDTDDDFLNLRENGGTGTCFTNNRSQQ